MKSTNVCILLYLERKETRRTIAEVEVQIRWHRTSACSSTSLPRVLAEIRAGACAAAGLARLQPNTSGSLDHHHNTWGCRQVQSRRLKELGLPRERARHSLSSFSAAALSVPISLLHPHCLHFQHLLHAMAPPADPAEIPLSLPPLPAKHKDFLHHVKSHPDTPMVELLTPYNDYDAVVRKLFAQEPSHPALQDNTLNILPLYGPDQSADVRIRARDLSSEPEELKQKYIMPLKDEDRKPNGSPAVVSTLKEFQTNFNLFCENSLSDLDWSNVVAAGSSVVTSLLPVPEEHRGSKRGLRQYYHETFAPASDVDLFLYGLTEEQAIEKIKQIEAKIKDSILYETTTIRTKNAITVVSQYPTRHVQIVLRIYKSIAEILTGFDVDCSCAAYDGQQVYLAPRALAAYITQTNHIDLSRRSPSYESRLSKYSHRGFEVFWPHLDRSRIDPVRIHI